MSTSPRTPGHHLRRSSQQPTDSLIPRSATEAATDDIEARWKAAPVDGCSSDPTLTSRSLYTWKPIVGIALIVLTLVGAIAGAIPCRHVVSSLPLHSRPSFMPQILGVAVNFTIADEYMDMSPSGDVLWNHLLPIGNGYMNIPYPRRYGLPQSRPVENSTTEEEVYAISATHQLHCLAMLRNGLKAAMQDQFSQVEDPVHLVHCLDYIRQAIMCNGDTSLEYAHARRDEDGMIISWVFNGEGTVHQCHDWSAIAEFAARHRNADRSGNIINA